MRARDPGPSRRAALATILVTLVLGALTRAVAPADAIGWSPYVDQPSGYDAQVTCTTAPRPGTVALARWLLRAYPVTRSMGMMRACGTGGRSEHKDGRAFDWGADVAKPATRKAAYDFITKALATDAAGNPHALARRLGIMYLIYNDTIWSSYRDFVPRPYLSPGCRTRRSCSRTLRHLNHVHISLGYAGAAAQTSWYRARNVASQPVLFGGTKDLDPELTAVTALTVPATGALTSSPFTLAPGVTYRIVVTGTVRYGPGNAVGDATCTKTADGTAFEPTILGPLGTGLPGTHGLVLQGGLPWHGDCRADHTYEAWITPLVRQRLQLRYLDVPLVPAGETPNDGMFTVYVARDDITLTSLAAR